MISDEPPAKLLDLVRQAIRRKHYSICTEDAYFNWIRRFVRFHHKRKPSQMGVWKLERRFSDAAREWDWQ